MSRGDGGAAFPGGVNQVYTNLDAGEPTQAGMTMRDYFAAKAMQSYLAHLSSRDGIISKDYQEAASEAYLIADAMLAARSAP